MSFLAKYHYKLSAQSENKKDNVTMQIGQDPDGNYVCEISGTYECPMREEFLTKLTRNMMSARAKKKAFFVFITGADLMPKLTEGVKSLGFKEKGKGVVNLDVPDGTLVLAKAR